MENHIFKVSMRGIDNSPAATFSQLKYLIRDSDVDKIIEEAFPLLEYNPMYMVT